MMYWQEEIETMNRSDLEELQLKRLKKTIESAKNSSHYGKLFNELNITSENIHSLDKQEAGWQAILNNFKKYTENLFNLS